MTPRRVSTTHGPRLDDELKHETSSLEHGDAHQARADEWRSPESSEPGELPADVADAAGPDGDPVLARRELSRHLRVGAFPADRSALLAEAEENAAPASVLDQLHRLPQDREFATVYEVWDALGGELEPRAQAVLDDRRHEEQAR